MTKRREVAVSVNCRLLISCYVWLVGIVVLWANLSKARGFVQSCRKAVACIKHLLQLNAINKTWMLQVIVTTEGSLPGFIVISRNKFVSGLKLNATCVSKLNAIPVVKRLCTVKQCSLLGRAAR